MGSPFVFELMASATGDGWADLSAPIAQSISPAGYMQVVLWIVGLFMLFVLGGFILIRGSRRYRERLLRQPSPPTPSDDIWKMHRLPDETEPEPEPDDPPSDADDQE